MKKEYYITFSYSVQISEDTWQVRNPSLKVTRETTVGDIEDFYRKYYKTTELEVKLIELS